MSHHSLFLSPATQREMEQLIAFHRAARFATDHPLLPTYTEAGIRDGYYERTWENYFKQAAAESCSRETVLIARESENAPEIAGFVRFGVVPTPDDSQLCTFGTEGWGELHQLYVAPERQSNGLGTQLFIEAAEQLGRWDCSSMLINVLSANQKARGFYHRMGAVFSHDIVERNTRDHIVFTVPCSLYVQRLGS